MTLPETFSIGTTIYVPQISQDSEPVPCPDCNDTHKWRVTAVGGLNLEIDCPRCHGGKSQYDFLKPQRRTRTAKVVECVVREVTVRQSRAYQSEDIVTRVHYETSPATGSIDQASAFTTREEAEAAAQAKLATYLASDRSDWEADRERSNKRAGIDILRALDERANEKATKLDESIDTLREKLFDAVRYPNLYGPKMKRGLFGHDELTSEALATWFNEIFESAGIERWSDAEIHEATCNC